MEPKNHEEALKDSKWVVAMQDELNEFERNRSVALRTETKTQKGDWTEMGI